MSEQDPPMEARIIAQWSWDPINGERQWDPRTQSWVAEARRDDFDELLETHRELIAAEIELALRPLIARSTWNGGYDCCGCATYAAILDAAIAVALGTFEPPAREDWVDD